MTLAFRSGFRLAASRITWRRLAVAAVLGSMAAFGWATAVRRASPLSAPDSLLSAGFAFGLPLVAYAIVGVVVERAGLSAATWPVARFGLSRRGVALGFGMAAWLASLVVVAPALALGLGAAYRGSPGFPSDCAVALGLAALGSGAYVGGFLLASTAMRRGRARSLVLVLDFVFGAGTSVLASPWPRAHLASLLGGDPVMQLTQRQSSCVLAVVAVGTLGWALARLRR